MDFSPYKPVFPRLTFYRVIWFAAIVILAAAGMTKVAATMLAFDMASIVFVNFLRWRSYLRRHRTKKPVYIEPIGWYDKQHPLYLEYFYERRRSYLMAREHRARKASQCFSLN